MSASALSRRGPKPKGGGVRKTAQVKLPPELYQELVDEAKRLGLPVTDLGALYLLQGWNAVRDSNGLSAVTTPAYLTQVAVEACNPQVERQETLLAG